MGIDLFSPNSAEAARLDLGKSLVKGELPAQQGEVLLRDDFSTQLGVKPGDVANSQKMWIDKQRFSRNYLRKVVNC